MMGATKDSLVSITIRLRTVIDTSVLRHNLYESFEITFDNLPCAKALGNGFKDSQ